MNDPIEDLKSLCSSYGIELRQCSDTHYQLIAHGKVVNYYPTARRKTVYMKNRGTIHNCTVTDAVKLLLSDGNTESLKPKFLRTKQKEGKDLVTLEDKKGKKTNPAGIKHFYSGLKPPWEFEVDITSASDLLRIEAYKLLSKAQSLQYEADSMDNPDTYKNN